MQSFCVKSGKKQPEYNQNFQNVTWTIVPDPLSPQNLRNALFPVEVTFGTEIHCHTDQLTSLGTKPLYRECRNLTAYLQVSVSVYAHMIVDQYHPFHILRQKYLRTCV